MPAAAAEPQATRVIAVRHGETTWNAALRMQGQLDAPLSPRGRWQAGRAAAALQGEGIDAIVSSDLSRARDTAAPLAERLGLPVATDPGLRERAFGIFEGCTYAEIDSRWSDDAARWRRHDPDFGPLGGETLRAFGDRAVAAMTQVAANHHGRSVAVFTHGGVLDCLYRAATRVGFEAARTWQLGNAAVNRLLWTERGFVLVGWSDIAHLDGEPPLDDASEGDSPARVVGSGGGPPEVTALRAAPLRSR